MAPIADIIPIASRRPHRELGRTAGAVAPTRTEDPPLGRGRVALLVLAGLLAVGLPCLLARSDAQIRVPGPARGAIFQRAHEDLLATCGVPEAAEGPIREHCVAQASFVLLFPECDVGCAQAARALLPHARR